METGDVFEKALVYYQVLFAVNRIRLTDVQMKFVAWCGVKGGCVSAAGVRTTFMERFQVKKNTVNSAIYHLKKMGVFMKKNGKIYLHDALVVNFAEHDILLNVKLQFNSKQLEDGKQ